MKYLLCIALSLFLNITVEAQLILLRNGQPITNGTTLQLKKGSKLRITAQLTTSNINMDDIDRFPDDVGDWIDSTTTGGNMIIETFEWRVSNDEIFDFFDANTTININFSVVVNGVETGIIDSDGSGLFSSVYVADSLDQSTPPYSGQLYKNSLPMAYAYDDSGGSILADYGISSVMKTNTGEYEVQLAVQPIGYPVATVTAVDPFPGNKAATVSVAPDINVIKVSTTSGGAASNVAFMIVVYGNY